MRAVGAGPAEFAIIVAIVAVTAKDPHSDQPGMQVCSFLLHMLVSVTGCESGLVLS